MAGFSEWWNQITAIESTWLIVGFAGQTMFMMRFVFQWIYSERAKRSVVPEVFWYCSIAGGLTILIYAIHRADPVIIAGQATGVSIYSRNIYFIWREKRRLAAATAGGNSLSS